MLKKIFKSLLFSITLIAFNVHSASFNGTISFSSSSFVLTLQSYKFSFTSGSATPSVLGSNNGINLGSNNLTYDNNNCLNGGDVTTIWTMNGLTALILTVPFSSSNNFTVAPTVIVKDGFQTSSGLSGDLIDGAIIQSYQVVPVNVTASSMDLYILCYIKASNAAVVANGAGKGVLNAFVDNLQINYELIGNG